MRPLTEKRRAITGGTGRTGKAGIAEKDMPKMLSILSDQLYTDKIAAVVREYSCNAWDAHVEGGIPTRPIEVILPSAFVPEFVVRDFGPGLSEDRVFNHYMMFGASDKEETNIVNGMFGLGCKAAYAYVTAFTIISYHGGKKSTYSAYIDGNQDRIVAKMGEEATTETGMEIRVPVQREDITLFRGAAKSIYGWFSPIPKCEGIDILNKRELGMSLTSLNVQMISSWKAAGLPAQWVATMGNVAYEVPLDQFEEALKEVEDEGDEETSGLLHFLTAAAGVLHFAIGDVTPHPSRERLSVDKATRAAVLERFLRIRAEAISTATAQIKKKQEAGVSTWELRKEIRLLLESLHLSRRRFLGVHLGASTLLPTEAADLPTSFAFKRVKWHTTSSRHGWRRRTRCSVKAVKSFPLRDEVLIIQNCDRMVARLEGQRHRVKGREGFLVLTPFAEDYSYNMKELQAFLKKLGADGMPTQGLDRWLPSVAPVNHERRQSHYSKDVFTSNGKRNHNRKSDGWDPYTGEINKDTVYVLIDHFIPDVVIDNVRAVEVMLRELFGFSEDMPTIVGVKPRARHLCKDATHYTAWLHEQIKIGLKGSKETRAALRAWAWSGRCGGSLVNAPAEDDVKVLRKRLHKDSPLLAFVERMWTANKAWEAQGTTKVRLRALLELLNSREELHPILRAYQRAPKKRARRILRRYPLLSFETLFWYRHGMWYCRQHESNAGPSITYINLIDDHYRLVEAHTKLKEQCSCKSLTS